jgi:hypothetical protein
MHVRFTPGQGFAVEQIVPDADALAYLVDQGIPRPEAIRVMSALKSSAVAKDRAHTMTEFIARHCSPSFGNVAFSEFFDRFRDSLPPGERYQWTRTVVTRALPPQHRTMPGTNNRKFVPGLSWRT